MQISKPTLVVESQQCSKNIAKMKAKAEKHNLSLRPHFKTHQNREIAELFRAVGITKCTVSSVEMAEYFASYGWDDITIAFPVNLLEIEKINQLNERITLNLLVESVASVNFLAENLSAQTGLFIKLDTGYHRTGIKAEDLSKIAAVLEAIQKSKKLQLAGLLTHAGQSYHATDKTEIRQIHHDSTSSIKSVKEHFQLETIISIGDTPTCSLADNFDGIDEIRCGNFVYYDLMQYYLGTCDQAEIAVKVACPVVAIHLKRNDVILYGGGIHFSKEGLDVGNKQIFGEAVSVNGQKLAIENYGYIRSLSQEHGILHFPKGVPANIVVGDLISVYPIHSCLSANLLRNDTVLI